MFHFILFIAGVCLIAIPTASPHQLARPSIPSTLLEIKECVNRTSEGVFQLNPSKDSGLVEHVMNISYNSCFCDDECDYWSPPPTCCKDYVSSINYFMVTVNRDNYENPTLRFNKDHSDGLYMSKGGSNYRHNWGWVSFAVSMVIFSFLVEIYASKWYKERKKKVYEDLS